MTIAVTSSNSHNAVAAPSLKKALIISLLTATAALAPIAYNLVVYDKIIASGSVKGLGGLLSGVAFVLICDLILRRYRNTMLLSLAVRLHEFAKQRIDEKLTHLPQSVWDRLTLSAQLIRFRDYDAVRDFLVSPLAATLLELPIICLYLLFVAMLCSVLVVAPLVMISLYTFLGFYSYRTLKIQSLQNARSVGLKNAFLIEALCKHEHIVSCGLENIWRQRWCHVSSAANLASIQAASHAQRLDRISHAITTSGIVLGLWVGVYAVTHSQLTIGGLIAAMMLLWRIVIPVQQLTGSLSRLKQIADCHDQLQNLNEIDDKQNIANSSQYTPLSSLNLQRLTLRFEGQNQPALLNITMHVDAGERIAICGESGSGKTALLNTLFGLYQPQAGTIFVNEKDSRQYSPETFQNSICYISQAPADISGDLRRFLTSGDNQKTDNDIYSALEATGALEVVLGLTKTIDTNFSDEPAYRLSQSQLRKLSLARALLHPAHLIFMDDIASSSADLIASTQQFMKHLPKEKSVLLITQSPDILEHVERAYAMRSGELFPLKLEKTQL